RLEHPNICQVFEVGEVDGEHFIAMQLIEGVSLGEAARSLPLADKLRLVEDAAHALHAAHKLGLIHRDVKPSNILIEKSADGALKPYVMDFGLARDLTTPAMTVTGELLGTPCYMAPEQARGKGHYDARTDVYSLGATLYQVLTGRPPFTGSPAEVLS